jgi:eukaryotic-like serine/threonine-protein kinase
MYKMANEPAPDIRIIRPELSEKLANIVALSISKRSEMRYQDGDQFAADLRAVMGDFVGSTNAASAATLSSSSQIGASTEAADFDATQVQSATVYESTQTMPLETSAFDKTVVSDIRGSEPKI